MKYPFTYEEHIEKAESMGLVHTTTKRQEKNGTIAFNDPIAECGYILYANGAIRRSLPGWFHARSYSRMNPVKRHKNEYGWYETEFIYFPGDYAKLFEILFARVPKYRKTVEKRKEKLY